MLKVLKKVTCFVVSYGEYTRNKENADLVDKYLIFKTGIGKTPNVLFLIDKEDVVEYAHEAVYDYNFSEGED